LGLLKNGKKPSNGIRAIPPDEGLAVFSCGYLYYTDPSSGIEY
jgi:hypothetical protein